MTLPPESKRCARCACAVPRAPPQYIACVCHIIACITGNDDIAALANLIDCIADLVWCT